MTPIALLISAVALIFAYNNNVRAEESLRQAEEALSRIDSPNKDASMGSFAQGNAPLAGGLNADSGPGNYQESPQYPPSEPRVNPGLPMDFGLNDCGIAAITLVVKKDSSVWETVALPYGHRGDAFLVGVVTSLQEFINANPSIPVRDVDVVPPGFEIVVSYDGSAVVGAA